MTALTVAIAWNTISDRSMHFESADDIEVLENWKRQVEQRVDWLKDDHDLWAQELQEANPGIAVPLTTQNPLTEEEADYVD